MTLLFYVFSGCKEITDIKVISGDVKLGSNVTVFCFVDNFVIDYKYVKWTHGLKDDLLTFDSSRPEEPQKYAETKNHSGFGLMIININKQDVNIPYTCTCGFFQLSTIIQLDESKYIWYYYILFWNQHMSIYNVC